MAATISSDFVTGGGTSTFFIASCSFALEQPLRDVDGHVLAHLQVVEADLLGDQRQQREDLEAELVARVRGAHLRPGRVVEAERGPSATQRGVEVLEVHARRRARSASFA